MRCFDAVTARYGRASLHTGGTILSGRAWNMRRNFLSPAYTTDVARIPEVY